MPTILQIETSSTNTSVVLTKNGKVIGVKEQDSSGYSHEKLLHPFIEEVLQQGGIALNEIDAVAIGTGPGSFTGLRIGVAAAKGLCFALDVPLIAVPTMELLARQVTTPVDRIIPIVDARRMEVYTAIYDKDYKELTPTYAKILDEDAYDDIENLSLVFVGSGARKLKELRAYKNAVFLTDSQPSALEMTMSALERFKAKIWEDTAYFEPFYLKDFKPH